MTDIAKTSAPIQVESTRFRSSVSEALLARMGGDINFLLASILPVGSVIHSLLTEAQFQDLTSDDWVLLKGQDVSDSEFAVITGITVLPDGRGIFLRGKNNGRADGKQNLQGEQALGAYEADGFRNHSHNLQASYFQETGGPVVHDDGSEFLIINEPITGTVQTPDISKVTVETRPKSLTMNIFIRIN